MMLRSKSLSWTEEGILLISFVIRSGVNPILPWTASKAYSSSVKQESMNLALLSASRSRNGTISLAVVIK